MSQVSNAAISGLGNAIVQPARVIARSQLLHRLTKGRSFSEIGRNANLPTSTVSLVLRGKRVPSVFVAARLAVAAGLSMEDWLRAFEAMYNSTGPGAGI